MVTLGKQGATCGTPQYVYVNVRYRLIYCQGRARGLQLTAVRGRPAAGFFLEGAR
jgi:hypothetical protein